MPRTLVDKYQRFRGAYDDDDDDDDDDHHHHHHHHINNFQMSHPVVLHNINQFFHSITTFFLILLLYGHITYNIKKKSCD
jgi:hypothetical protein